MILRIDDVIASSGDRGGKGMRMPSSMEYE
jgi:hypothetical protein